MIKKTILMLCVVTTTSMAQEFGQATSGGNSAFSPKLTPQSKDYLVARLNAYRSGTIQHPQMSLIAQMISEQDIENVAAWYSGIEIKVVKTD